MYHQIEVWKDSRWQLAIPGVTGITKRVCGVMILKARIRSRAQAEDIARSISRLTGLPSRITCDGLTVWRLLDPDASIDSLTVPEYQQEETKMATPDLNEPLIIPRQALIDKLEENLAAEVAKREKAEADRAAERQEMLDAIAAFTPDELYNIFRRHYAEDVSTLKWDKEHKTFVTADLAPTPIETDLEKFTRVLTMATQDNIEVTPNESLYRLL